MSCDAYGRYSAAGEGDVTTDQVVESQINAPVECG